VKFLKALDALNKRRIKGKDAKEKVSAFFAACHPRLRKWYMRVLEHELRLGVSRKTVENVFGTEFWTGAEKGAFHYHGCNLAKKFESVYPPGKEPEWPMAAEFKLDGERSLPFIFRRNNVPELRVYTRGKLRKTEIEGVAPLVAQFAEFSATLAELAGLPSNSDMFLDGEFLATSWNDTSSVVSKTKNFDEAAFLSQVKVILFDWAPVSAYVEKQYDLPWKKRKELLMRAAGAKRPFEKVKKCSDNLYVLGHRLVYNMEELSAFHERSLDGGFEGTMLKVVNAPHVFDRKHKYVLKLKPEDDATGVIVECHSGEGMHDVAATHDKNKVKSIVAAWLEDNRCETVHDDGSYFHVKCFTAETAEELISSVKEVVQDNTDHRLSRHMDDLTVSYRYGPRLGYFVVDWEGERIHVGGGIRYKAGGDDRMDYWQRRDELVGKKLDFKVQKDSVSVAKARFNKFVRIREDLSTAEDTE